MYHPAVDYSAFREMDSMARQSSRHDMIGSVPSTWSARPAVVASLAANFPRRARILRNRNPWWVLDYNFNDIGRVALGARPGDWWPRATPVGHLYAPQVEYIEDFTGQTVRSAFVIFDHGRAAGLDRLISPSGFARFEDPAGRLGELLIEVTTIDRTEASPEFCAAQAALWRVMELLHRAVRIDKNVYRIGGSGKDSGDAASVSARVEQYLRRNLADPVSLRDLATHLGISESHVSHRYRQETGVTPMTTLLRLRIELAKTMLLKGMPLKWIAEQTGFSDAFHLSRTFKRVTGQSPSHYRLAVAGGDA
jgi:AraC-like DNA-binding protein